MSSIGPERLIEELPPAWRRAAYAALFAVSMTAGYFLFVQTPIARAQSTADHNGARITAVENDISAIKGDVSEIRQASGARDQKIDDLKDSVASMNNKLDRLLTRGQHPVFP